MFLVALFVVSKHWEYPQMSKNRGPVCKGMCYAVLSRFSCVHLWGTLWTVVRQAPLSMGFSRQEYWSGLPCPPPGDLPNPGIKPRSLRSPALAGRLFTTSATGEAQQGNPTQQWKRRTADAYNNLDPVSVGHRDVLPDAESQTEKHTLWVHVREVLKQANGLYGDSHQISEKEREQRECPAFYTLTGSGGHSCRYLLKSVNRFTEVFYS